MKRLVLTTAILTTTLSMGSVATEPALTFQKLWSFHHGTDVDGLPVGQVSPLGQLSEIPAFDSRTNTLWVVGIVGVDVLEADTGALVKHIDVTTYGNVNSVAVHNGLVALAVEAGASPAPGRARPGRVLFFDTKTLSLSDGINNVVVGALPDMLTFTHDGSKLLVANEATPNIYGSRIGTSVPRVYGPAPDDPAGSVTIIDMETRTVLETAGFSGVPTVGDNLRTNTGMDFEPEYIAVTQDGTEAYVTLQEANAIGVLDLTTNKFTKIIGLGAKDFSHEDNQIDPLNEGVVTFGSHAAKGLYMPDTIATHTWLGETYLVMANEGDFREDDGDRSAASSLGAVAPLNNLRVSNTDSSAGNLYAAGARSFSIRDKTGNIIYDSGDFLDKKANELGIYDDGRSRDKGVEPEGLTLLDLGGRTYAFVALERTLTSAVAIFDITDPTDVRFVDIIVTGGDLSPEGLAAYKYKGQTYLAISNEVPGSSGFSNTTLYSLERGKPSR
jgi:DNA-binding beta-propeller fold protein YncE